MCLTGDEETSSQVGRGVISPVSTNFVFAWGLLAGLTVDESTGDHAQCKQVKV